MLINNILCCRYIWLKLLYLISSSLLFNNCLFETEATHRLPKKHKKQTNKQTNTQTNVTPVVCATVGHYFDSRRSNRNGTCLLPKAFSFPPSTLSFFNEYYNGLCNPLCAWVRMGMGVGGNGADAVRREGDVCA